MDEDDRVHDFFSVEQTEGPKPTYVLQLPVEHRYEVRCKMIYQDRPVIIAFTDMIVRGNKCNKK